jgi:hypothetical protein
MSSYRESLMLQGKLMGMGYDAPCTLSAVKVSLPQLNVLEYVRCEILDAPHDLPDGQYFVAFEGRMAGVRKMNGEWDECRP